MYGEVVYFMAERIHQLSEGRSLSYHNNTPFPVIIGIGHPPIATSLVHIVPCRSEILSPAADTP
jgi:hypothetical protein